MTIGTRSVLYGAHCFLLHPFFVAAAWRRLYGFPWDPRLWFAFFLHDIGYIGKPNMDGQEGETHPYLGAGIMGVIFGQHWFNFTLYHSRFLAKKFGAKPSRLCAADKYALCITPAWLYLPMVKATGEISEYMNLADKGKYDTMNCAASDARKWYLNVQRYLRRWVVQHKDGGEDTWTPAVREALDSTGTYK